MKKTLYVFGFALVVQSLFSQEFNSQLVLLADQPEEIRREIQSLCTQEKLNIGYSQRDAYNGDHFKISGQNEKMERFISAFISGKEVVSKNQTSFNYNFEIKNLEEKIQFFEKKISSLQNMRSRMPIKNDSLAKLNPFDVSILIKDKKGNIVSQYSYTTAITEKSVGETNSEALFLENLSKQELNLTDSIYKAKSEIQSYKSKTGTSTLDLTIKRRLEAGTEENFAFVNMPGASFDIMALEKPNSNTTAELYKGYKLKYLFSKGKSYFTLGSLSALRKSQDSSAYTDIFLWGIGSDFYPKYLGRGQRTFLNLYTGLEFGGAIYVSPSESKHYFNLQPKLGLELVKTARILIDVNSSYYIPFSIKNNQNLRAIIGSASLNFIF